ncbi:hypothetical protein NDU88_002558, partial [Pleurodeles waltl]
MIGEGSEDEKKTSRERSKDEKKTIGERSEDEKTSGERSKMRFLRQRSGTLQKAKALPQFWRMWHL